MLEDKIVLREGTDPMALMAAANGGGFGNNWANNPFAYIMFMWLFGALSGNGFGWGNRNEGGVTTADYAALVNNLNTTNGNELVMNAINGNRDAISTLSQTLNCDANRISDGICAIRSAIQDVSGQVGFSSEKVINAINMGDCNVIQAIQNCCCNTQKEILKTNYENQLATCNQTNVINGRIDQLANGIQTGFTQVGYSTAQQTCNLLQGQNANTQRIIDVLNNHWTQELASKYADAKFELSQQAQTNYLIEQLKTTSTTSAA